MTEGASKAKDPLAKKMRTEIRVDLSRFMSASAIADLVRELHKTDTPKSRALANELRAASKKSERSVTVPGRSLDGMLSALPGNPALRHLRRTLGSICTARDKRVDAILNSTSTPSPTLLENAASGGRRVRARLRAGPFDPR